MLQDGSCNKIICLNWIESDIDNKGVTKLVLKGNLVGLEVLKETYSVFYETR